MADALLGGGTMVGMAATALAASLAEVETALRAVGALPAGSPAVARLAALCQQRSVPLRGDLATRARATGLPGPWASVLAQRRDGPGKAGPACCRWPPCCPRPTGPGSCWPACPPGSAS